MDCTFRAVRILGERLPREGIFVSELDPIYYMVSSVFGYGMKHITCSVRSQICCTRPVEEDYRQSAAGHSRPACRKSLAAARSTTTSG
jgi:hypothetical protein